MIIRILESDQAPGHRHTHEVEIIDDGKTEVTVMTTEHSEHGREHGTPPEDFRQHHTDVTHPNSGEREFEVGMDEHWKAAMGLLFSNNKRTYDEYQQESLQTMREMRLMFAKLVSDAQGHSDARSNIATQALQNAVETANMVGKQGVRHSDIAIDRQWNIDEQTQATRAFDEHVAGGVHPHGNVQSDRTQ